MLQIIGSVVNEVLSQKKPQNVKEELSRSRLEQILHQGHCMLGMHLVKLSCVIYQSRRMGNVIFTT